MKRMLKMAMKARRDILAAIVIVGLIVTSILMKYSTGMLVGFLTMFVLLMFDRIKRIIFDMNVKKIFGIEFGEREREEIKERVREEVEKTGITLPDFQIDAVADAALNQVTGVSNKGRYYEEMINYALKDLDLDYQARLSAVVEKKYINIDFVIESDNSRVIGIEAAYSGSCYLSKQKTDQVIETVRVFKKYDNLSHFLIITNAEVREEDKQRLLQETPPIDVIENRISPDGILSAVDEYLSNINHDTPGSLGQ
jgi:hypothetical protein